MKKKYAVIASLVLTMFSLSACGGGGSVPSSSEPAQNSRTASVAFATSGQGGTFYTAGAGISALVTDKVPGLTVTAETTKGVVENMRLLANGETEMGFAYSSTAYDITNGAGVFAGQSYDGIRGVAGIHDGAMNIVTTKNSSINTLQDLVGKSVAIGPQGSGSADVSEQLLKSAGIFEQCTIQYLSFDDSSSSLRDGHTDALIIGGSTPVPTLIELEASKPLKFIPVDGEVREKFLKDHPYYVPYTIPASGYSSLSEPVETVGYPVVWVADASVEDWIVYEMLKAMFSDEGKSYLQNVQAAFSEMQPGLERFAAINLPLHPGAEQYYKEIGLLK